MSNAKPNQRARRMPLDAAALDRLALRYVERFATTRGKLADYLQRKVRERGWEGPAADPAGVAERMAALGYVDDRSFAAARAASLTRRGYGRRRVAEALRQAHIEAGDAADALAEPDDDGAAVLASALAFARRRRIGPFAATPAADPLERTRRIAAMLRAGHDYALVRRIVDLPPGAAPPDPD